MLLSRCRSTGSMLLALLIGILPVLTTNAQGLVDFETPAEGGQEWVVFAGEAGAPLTVHELEWIEMPSVREQMLAILPALAETKVASTENLISVQNLVENGVYDSFSYGVLVGDSALGYVVIMVFQDIGFRAAQVVYTSNDLDDAMSAADLLVSNARGEQPIPVPLPSYTPECPCESSCQANLQVEESTCVAENFSCVKTALGILAVCFTGCAFLGGPPCLAVCIAFHAVQLFKCDADLRICRRSSLAKYKICLLSCDGDPGPQPDPFTGY